MIGGLKDSQLIAKISGGSSFVYIDMVANVPVVLLRQAPTIKKVRKTVEVHHVQFINEAHGAVSCEFFSSSGRHCCVCPRPVVAPFVVALVSLVPCALCDSTSINDRLNERCLERSRPSVCPLRCDSCDFTALKIVHAGGERFLHFPSRSGREVPVQ